jgi:pyruvate/2-oxoglutarate dehydrogenase complex dihydrolipoamide acyltransferase (E2) component
MMKTIDQLLQQLYKEPDNAAVSVTLTVPLGTLRHRHNLFAELQIESISQNNAPAKGNKKKSTPSAAAEKPAKRAAAPAKKAKRASSKRAPTKVTISGVTKALAEGHHSPTAIAQALGTSPKVVSTSLSRYLQKGLVVRTGPGLYGLPTSGG